MSNKPINHATRLKENWQQRSGNLSAVEKATDFRVSSILKSTIHVRSIVACRANFHTNLFYGRMCIKDCGMRSPTVALSRIPTPNDIACLYSCVSRPSLDRQAVLLPPTATDYDITSAARLKTPSQSMLTILTRMHRAAHAACLLQV